MSGGDGHEKPHPPPVMWAQRADKVYLTINLEDCVHPTITMEEDKIFFSGKGGTENKVHEVTVEFFKEIDPKESHYAVMPRHIPMVLRKKESGFWDKLIKGGQKVHWLKTDFDKWRDPDDSDVDDDKDMQFEEMMKKMGNFNATGGGGGGPEDEPDSDDEELPDLE